MKDDLPFFSHDNCARSHPKMRALIAQFGAAGYGQFWMLNELICQAKDARLDLTKRVNKGAVAAELFMTFTQLDTFLDFLKDPEIDLVTLENGILTTDRTQEDYAAVRAKRDRNRDEYHSKRTQFSGNPNSDSEKSNSASGIDTEQNRAEEKREEQPRARGDEPVENSEAEAFAAWARDRARKAHARNPAAYAKTILDDPVALEEFRESRKPKPDDSTFFAPPPPECECGGDVYADLLMGEGQCRNCSAWWRFDRTFEVWKRELEAG